MNMLFVIDPFEGLNPKKDTSLALMQAAAERGHSVFICEIGDLSILLGKPYVVAAALTQSPKATKFFDKNAPERRVLTDFEAIFMRKDPPVNAAFVFATQIMELAEQKGSLVVNRCSSLRDCNEKLFAAQFPHLMSPTLVSSNKAELRAFVEAHEDVIVKPLDGMGGVGIFRLRLGDPNISSVLETLLASGLPIMAQVFVPEIRFGDKRILVVNGKPMPFVLARIPASGETRGNLAAGGSGVVEPLSEADRKIAEEIAPELLRRGLLFVGLDVIGNTLTEINVTSPTCVREIEAETELRIGQTLIAAVEEKVGRLRR